MAGAPFDGHMAASLAAMFPLASDDFEDSLDVVSSKLADRVGRPYSAAKQAAMAQLHTFYDQQAELHHLPAVKALGTNLSYVLYYEVAQMKTAYHNNVARHFDAYLAAVVRRSVLAAYGVDDAADLSTADNRAFKFDVRVVKKDVLERRQAPMSHADYHELVGDLVATCMLQRPPRARQSVATRDFSDFQWRHYDLKEHPGWWLPFMVHMNGLLQQMNDQGGWSLRLYRPTPTRRSFIPNHIRLDTQGLLDLLIQGEDELAELKVKVEGQRMGSGGTDEPLYDLPGVMGAPTKRRPPRPLKNNFMTALADIVAPELRLGVLGDPVAAAAHYRTALWRAITKAGSNRHCSLEYRGGIFNNIIDTDGFSISMHFVPLAQFGHTNYNGGFAIRLKAK